MSVCAAQRSGERDRSTLSLPSCACAPCGAAFAAPSWSSMRCCSRRACGWFSLPWRSLRISCHGFPTFLCCRVSDTARKTGRSLHGRWCEGSDASWPARSYEKPPRLAGGGLWSAKFTHASRVPPGEEDGKVTNGGEILLHCWRILKMRQRVSSILPRNAKNWLHEANERCITAVVQTFHPCP